MSASSSGGGGSGSASGGGGGGAVLSKGGRFAPLIRRATPVALGLAKLLDVRKLWRRKGRKGQRSDGSVDFEERLRLARDIDAGAAGGRRVTWGELPPESGKILKKWKRNMGKGKKKKKKKNGGGLRRQNAIGRKGLLCLKSDVVLKANFLKKIKIGLGCYTFCFTAFREHVTGIIVLKKFI